LANGVMIRVGFAFFDDIISNLMSRFSGSKFYWILGYNTGL